MLAQSGTVLNIQKLLQLIFLLLRHSLSLATSLNDKAAVVCSICVFCISFSRAAESKTTDNVAITSTRKLSCIYKRENSIFSLDF